MNSREKDVWKHVVAKCKGMYGKTDYGKKTITINKSYHKSKNNHANGIKKNKDGTANILDTIVHEEMHKNHPKMKEKTVRKLAPKKAQKLSTAHKKRLYNKYQ